MDTPFMSGYITERCIRIIKKINPNSIIYIPFDDKGIFLNNDILKFFSKKKDNIKNIIMNILDKLTHNELEELYIYNINSIGKCKNIIDITINFKTNRSIINNLE